MPTNNHECELCIGLSRHAHDYCKQLHVQAMELAMAYAEGQGMTREAGLNFAYLTHHTALCDMIRDGVMVAPASKELECEVMLARKDRERKEARAKRAAMVKDVGNFAAETAVEAGKEGAKGVGLVILAFTVVFVIALIGAAIRQH